MYLRTNIILIPLLLAQFFSSVEGDSLETTDDAEFTKLIKEEKYVVALFCPSGQEERCEEYESELASAREDLIDVMEGDGWVVKLVDSKEIEKFVVGKTDKPVVVMFRSGLPVIYNGPANEEVMLEELARMKEPGMRELTDSTFEHQTQAATGATTGDWLVMFFTPGCELCQRLTAALETVGCQQRGRANVASVNKETYGEKTGRRFELGLGDQPDIILFRQGKMYRYNIDKFDPDSLMSFMNGFYKNLPAENIPLPKTPFDDLVQLCVDYLKEYPLLVSGCASLPVLLCLAFYFLTRSEEQKPRKSKKKKSKDKDREENGEESGKKKKSSKKEN